MPSFDYSNFLTQAAADARYAAQSLVDAKGDLLVGTADNTAARLAVGTDGQVLTADSAQSSGVKWAAPSGSSVPVWPLDKNLSAGSGDLFSGTSLDGGWSSLQSTALTATDRPDGALVLRNSGNTSGQDRGLKRSFSPAGDFSVWTRINGATLTTNYQWCALFVGAADPSDGASGHRLQVMFVFNTSAPSGVHFKFAKYDAGAETGIVDTGITGLAEPFNYSLPLWLRIKRVGSTLTAGYSYDGSQFIDHPTTTTISFTVGTLGLILGESTATAAVRASFAYVVTA